MSKSLTDAVKAAATQTASLTDAVKEAARSGADSTVVSFPRLAFEARHEAMPGAGSLARAAAPDLDSPAGGPPAPRREHVPEPPADADLAPAPAVGPQPAGPQASGPSPFRPHARPKPRVTTSTG